MLNTYAVSVRWPAFAERVEYVSAASVADACAIVMRGEAEDLGDIDYFDDDAGDHWITAVEMSVSDDPRIPDESLPIPAEYERKATPASVADELLRACRMALQCLEHGTGTDTPAGAATLVACAAAIQAAEEAQA